MLFQFGKFLQENSPKKGNGHEGNTKLHIDNNLLIKVMNRRSQ